MGTLIEEIFSRKAGRPVQAGEILLLDVDYIMSHDNTTPLAIKASNSGVSSCSSKANTCSKNFSAMSSGQDGET